MIDKHVLLATLLSLAACGDDGNTVTPDAPPPDGTPVGGNDVTVEIHKGFPFVDGDTADDATFVAVQDGDGPFVAATGTNGVYKVHITNDRFGVAVGCNDSAAASFVDIEIIQQTVADGLVYKTFCKSQPDSATLNVTVKNLPAGQRLRLRTPRNVGTAGADGTLISTVPSGTTELFGTLTDANRNVLKLFRIPSIEVAQSANVTIDVAADGAAPDVSGTFTVSPDDPTSILKTAVVRPYGSVTLTGATNPIGASRSYLMVPAPLRQGDDLFRFTMTGATGSTSRTAKTPGVLAFALPTQFTAPNPELKTTPFLHPVWTFDPTPSALPNQSYFLDASNFGDFTAPLLRDWFVTLSARWVAGQTTVRYEFPDLSGMPGFADVALIARERLDTTIQRLESSAAFNVDGAESTNSSSFGVIGEFCGDGVTQNPPEACDPGDAGESETCDFDCTPAECGDGITNGSAGEECDPPDGATCSAECKSL
jgi:hypothetical protein